MLNSLFLYLLVHVLQLMNQHIDHGLTEPQVLKIFCDMCEAVSVMHHFNPPLTHRDLKVSPIDERIHFKRLFDI